MGFIYCIENKINHKKYIGQTRNSVKQRFYLHCHDHINDGTVLHNAMKSYGIENFFVTTLLECPNEELNSKEREYILKYNTHWRDGDGYNMSYGGENSPDVLERRVACYKLDDDLEIIPSSRQVFKSLSEASRQLSTETEKIFTSYIVQICRGRKYQVFHYTFCYIDENGNDIPTNYQGIKGSRNASKQNIWIAIATISNPVILIDNNNNYYYYNSMKEAGRAEHICPKTLKDIINNNREISFGRHKGWRAIYAKDASLEVLEQAQKDEETLERYIKEGKERDASIGESN